jgi:hypothetical protein
LKSIYGIRNKRNIAHIGIASPKEMDATLILYSAKWVFAELLLQSSGMSIADAQAAVDTVIERRLCRFRRHPRREPVAYLRPGANSGEASGLLIRAFPPIK